MRVQILRVIENVSLTFSFPRCGNKSANIKSN
jgi:hypothetical protein